MKAELKLAAYFSMYIEWLIIYRENYKYNNDV